MSTAPADPDDLPPDEDLVEGADAPEVEEAEVAFERHEWRIGKNLERRLDQYLVDRIGYLSRAQVQRLVEEGFATVNGRTTKSSYRPREGDMVAVQAPPPRAAQIEPEPIPLNVIYEDDHLLALNKQPDLIVHPARGQWNGTLVNGLIHYGKKWSTINGDWRPGILHRLDRNTTGVMLVAKSDEAHWRLARQFELRTIQKTYVAVIHGMPQLMADVIDMPIGKDRYVREKQAVRKLEAGGKEAVTKYEVLERFAQTSGPGRVAASAAPSPAPNLTLHPSAYPQDRKLPPPPGNFAFVKLSPKTGRTHQLRVHMSHIGHPMVGDTMYGGHVLQHGDWRFDRQALHAFEINFVHPVSLQRMTLAAPIPQDMERLLAVLRGKSSTGGREST